MIPPLIIVVVVISPEIHGEKTANDLTYSFRSFDRCLYPYLHVLTEYIFT